MSILEILATYRSALLAGLGTTLKLCLIIWGNGLFIGGLLGACGFRWRRVVGFPSRFFSFILSGIPALVLLFWLHYPLQSLLHVVIDPFYTAAAALSVINIFAVADIIRCVLADFPKQYLVAAKVCGISPGRVFYNIQFPIVLRQILPELLVQQVFMLQASIFASLISVEDIFRVAQRINARIYRPVEVYTTLGLFFLAACLPLNGLAMWMRRKFTRDISDR